METMKKINLIKIQLSTKKMLTNLSGNDAYLIKFHLPTNIPIENKHVGEL